MRSDQLTGGTPPAPDEAVAALQLDRLRAQLGRVRDSSAWYRDRFAAIGFDPRSLSSLEEYGSLPLLTTKADEAASERASREQEGHPFGLHLTVDPTDVVGVSTSSGTSGTPTYSHLYTAQDLRLSESIWARALRWITDDPHPRVLNGFGLSMWAVGTWAAIALSNIGARPLPVGAEGGPARLLRVARDLRPDILMCTPSLAERLVGLATDEGGAPVASLGIKALLLSAEPGGGLDAVRRRLSEEYEADVFDAMVGAYGVGKISCAATPYTGLHHLTEDFFLHELYEIDSDRAVPVADGAEGRVAYTSLVHQARPSIKTVTGDVVRVETDACPGCGESFRRFFVLGRTDDMMLVNGVNLHPSAVKDVLQQFGSPLTGIFRLRVRRIDGRVRAPLQLVAEVGSGAAEEDTDRLRGAIEGRVFDLLRVRVVAELVPRGDLDGEGQRKSRVVEFLPE